MISCLSTLAYIGPGGALSAIGTLLALVAAVALAVVGFLWYPIKRLLRSRRRDKDGTDATGDPGSAATDRPAK